MLDDLVENTYTYAKYCVTISAGYFLSDSLFVICEWIRNNGKDDAGSNIHILSHHLGTFITLYYGICNRIFIGYSTMCLLSEVSSVFLKTRKIWKINQYTCIGDGKYKTLVVINIIFFVIFRLFIIIFATFRWLKDIQRLRLLQAIVPTICCIIVGGINLRYFYILVKCDIVILFLCTKDKPN